MLRGWEISRKTREKFCFDCCVCGHARTCISSSMTSCSSKHEESVTLRPWAGGNISPKIIENKHKTPADSPEIWLKPWEPVKKLPAFPLLTHPSSLSLLSPLPPVIELNTPPHTLPPLNCHSIFHSSSVSHVSPRVFMLRWTKARHLPATSGCACLFS